MSYKAIFTFSTGQTGQTLNAQLYNSAGAVHGSAITTGIAELAGGIYQYYGDIDAGFYGSILFYESGSPTPILAYATLSPPETEAHLREIESDGVSTFNEDDMLRMQASESHGNATTSGDTVVFNSLNDGKPRITATVNQSTGQRTVTARDGT